MEKIYEVCDATNDEMYYTMGVFLSKEEAIKGINKACTAEHPLTEYADDGEYEKIEVTERKIGMSGQGTAVYTLERHVEYDEKMDEYRWVKL